MLSRARRRAQIVNHRGWRCLALACGVAAVACALYPTNHVRDYAVSRGGKTSDLVQFVEYRGRHVNTVLLVVLPLVKRDPVGVAQLLQAGAFTIIATHGGKRVLNGVVIGETRLGQRPLQPQSRHNSPSGHSSLASMGAFFIARRYGWLWLLLLLPVMVLTMWARVQLDAHTVSAVLAGMFIGLAPCFWLVSPRRDDAPASAATAGSSVPGREQVQPGLIGVAR